jgi:hypothetical protein
MTRTLTRAAGAAALALTAMATTTGTAAAQTPALARGSILLDGSAGFTVTDAGGDDNFTTFSLAPSALFFLSDGLALGGSVNLTISSVGDNTSTSYGIGPALSYYFVQDGSMHPFVEGSVRYARSSTEVAGQDLDFDEFGFRLGAGLLFLLSDAVGVDAGLFFDRTEGDNGLLEQTLTTFGLAIGVSAFVF